MGQLFAADIRVRQSIHKCFQNLILESQRNANLELYEEVGYQLAFCYRVGFGFRKDENECQKWLLESKRHVSDLESQLQTIKSSKPRRYDSTSSFGLLFIKGHVPDFCDVQYYRERDRLKDIYSSQENEINDWKIVFGCSHWMVLSREEQYFNILLSLGHWDKAEDLVRETVKNLKAGLPPDDFRVLRAQSSLAMACVNQGKVDEAGYLIKEVLRKSDKDPDNDRPARLIHESLLASVYAAQGKFAKAIKIQSEVYRKLSGTFGENHVQTLRALWNLREDYFRRGHRGRAASLNHRLLETATKALGDDHELTILAKIGSIEVDYYTRRWLWGHFGPREKLEPNLDLVRDSQRILGNEHPTTLQLMSYTAKHLMLKTRIPEAIALGEEIIERSISRAGPNHPDTVARQRSLEFAKATYRWYSRFERIGSVRLGDYIITPSFGVRFGLERVWGPLYRRTDARPMLPFLADAQRQNGEPGGNEG